MEIYTVRLDKDVHVSISDATSPTEAVRNAMISAGFLQLKIGDEILVSCPDGSIMTISNARFFALEYGLISNRAFLTYMYRETGLVPDDFDQKILDWMWDNRYNKINFVDLED